LFITIALEQELSKRRILEIYLNIIEWGDGIYGLGPAARYYFQKHPSELTDEECAFLASIIARPKNRWRPDPLSRLGDGWRQYVDLIVKKMDEKELPEERQP
jgi:membrane peptidoglycan carboxypeptidase